MTAWTVCPMACVCGFCTTLAGPTSLLLLLQVRHPPPGGGLGGQVAGAGCSHCEPAGQGGCEWAGGQHPAGGHSGRAGSPAASAGSGREGPGVCPRVSYGLVFTHAKSASIRMYTFVGLCLGTAGWCAHQTASLFPGGVLASCVQANSPRTAVLAQPPAPPTQLALEAAAVTCNPIFESKPVSPTNSSASLPPGSPALENTGNVKAIMQRQVACKEQLVPLASSRPLALVAQRLGYGH